MKYGLGVYLSDLSNLLGMYISKGPAYYFGTEGVYSICVSGLIYYGPSYTDSYSYILYIPLASMW